MPGRVSPAAIERLEGWPTGAAEAGIASMTACVQRGVTIEEGASAALQWLQEGVRSTAIQCAHDLVAIGAADTVLNQGFRIPQDAAVAGFGNVLAVNTCAVDGAPAQAPSGHRWPWRVMMKLLRGEPVSTQRLQAQLEIRASTGAPLRPPHREWIRMNAPAGRRVPTSRPQSRRGDFAGRNPGVSAADATGWRWRKPVELRVDTCPVAVLMRTPDMTRNWRPASWCPRGCCPGGPISERAADPRNRDGNVSMCFSIPRWCSISRN
ncbi:MAG: substrate-binding domain-containing protein [Verrucomicrobiae bacterium]|nr:substrate-binding domain-containing protein [Verrucomicrobiae bacterium]